jgi:hypothetical protein
MDADTQRVVQGWPNTLPSDVVIPEIPLDMSYFLDMKATDSGRSADLDQTMAINTMMAVTMFGIIQNFYYARPITFHRVNVTLGNGAVPEYINPRFLEKSHYTHTRIANAELYQGFQLEIPYQYFSKALLDFHTKEYGPFKQMSDKAVRDQKKLDDAEKAKELQAIADNAVAAAMKANGWQLNIPSVPPLKPPVEKGFSTAVDPALKKQLEKDIEELLAKEEALGVAQSAPKKKPPTLR